MTHATVTASEQQRRTTEVMDRFDRDILNYMMLWDPHGALYDEDIFPAFGMRVPEFRRRFVWIISSHSSATLNSEDRDLLDRARGYLQHCQRVAVRAAVSWPSSPTRLLQGVRSADRSVPFA